MAKKVFLHDLDENKLLPITRGELVLDSSGEEAFHSSEFLANNSLPGLMSAADKIKLDILSNIPCVIGKDSDQKSKWTGESDAITKYVDGLSIIYVPKVAGTVSKLTLLINELPAKPITISENDYTSADIAAGSPLLLTYSVDSDKWFTTDCNQAFDIPNHVWICEDINKTKIIARGTYAVSPNSYVPIIMPGANSQTSASMRFFGTSSTFYPIYLNGQPVSESNYGIPKGFYLVYFDGSYVHLNTNGILPGKIDKSVIAEKVQLNIVEGDGPGVDPDYETAETLCTSLTLTKGNQALTDTVDVIKADTIQASGDGSALDGTYTYANVPTTQYLQRTYKVLLSYKHSPNTSGAATEFIDTIVQDVNGDITATKKYIPKASYNTYGIIQVGDNLDTDGNGVLSAIGYTYEGDGSFIEGDLKEYYAEMNSHIEGLHLDIAGSEGTSLVLRKAPFDTFNIKFTDATTYVLPGLLELDADVIQNNLYIADGLESWSTIITQLPLYGILIGLYSISGYGIITHVDTGNSYLCVVFSLNTYDIDQNTDVRPVILTFSQIPDEYLGDNFTFNNTASVAYILSHAEGLNGAAFALGHSEGVGTNSVIVSHAEGDATTAINYSHSEGMYTHSDYISHAEGFKSSAIHISHAEGVATLAYNASHAEGALTLANGLSSHAEGYNTKSVGDNSHAEGYFTEANGNYSHSEGFRSHAESLSAHAEGQETHAEGRAAHSEGFQSYAKGASSHAEGDRTNATGWSSHAEGLLTRAVGEASHAEGYETLSYGKYSHAEGQGNIVDDQYVYIATSGSDDTYIITDGTDYKYLHVGMCLEYDGEYFAVSYVEKSESAVAVRLNKACKATASQANPIEFKLVIGAAYGAYSHVEGKNNTATGVHSHAEGNTTRAFGESSHTEGRETNALLTGSHAEGNSTTSSGYASHAEGHQTKAENSYAHSEGSFTIASGSSSHTEGHRTQAKNSFEHAQGCYNKSNTSTDYKYQTISSIGIGKYTGSDSDPFDESKTSRKNAFEVMANGDAYLVGVGDYDGTNPTTATTLQTVINNLNGSSGTGDIPVATSGALGGIKIGYSGTGKNYPVILDTDNKAYVSVPWTDTPYTLPTASSNLLGGIKIGYSESGANLAVKLASEKAYVTLSKTAIVTALGFTPGTGSGSGEGTVTSITPGIGLTGANGDSAITSSGTINLKQASTTELGGIKTNYTANDKNYAVKLDNNGNAYVNVPWLNNTYTVNNGTLTLQIAGTQKATHSANTSSSATFNVPEASSGDYGVIKVSSKNASAVTVNSETTTAGRYYPVELNSDGKAIVNVPWSDTKNTAGSSNSASDLFIIGATSLGTNQQTYSNSSVKISSNAVKASGGFYQESDERLKDFKDDILVDLEQLSKLPKKTFTWKHDDTKETHIGTSAQAVQKLYPELVKEDSDGTLSVAYDKLSIIALKAIDELYKRNIELEKRIKELENK